jgi:hypothetical protein
MARRARGTATEKEQELPILTALRFVSIAQQPEGTPYQTHCRFTGSEVVAFNGVLAAGHPCEEIMDACPHTLDTIAALSRMRGAFSLTLLDRNKLILNSEKFRAQIDCLAPVEVDTVIRHDNAYPLNDAFKDAAERAGIYITEAAQTVMESSVYSLDGSIIGTNGKILLECWHGNPFPPGLIIPYTAIKALKKIPLHIVGFGFDTNGITFHFENGAWLRTQLFRSDYPRLDNLRAKMDSMMPAPKVDELEKAVNAVLPFSETSGVWINQNVVMSHATNEKGAQYKCDGLPFDMSFNGEYYLKIASFVTAIDFTTDAQIIMFRGDQVRGMMTGYGK